jgi:hypothetical protein
MPSDETAVNYMPSSMKANPDRHLRRQVTPPVTTRSLAEVGFIPDAGLVSPAPVHLHDVLE